nr:low-density lipoprotein receptor-related protein 2-like [Penaeus vannamei]
MKLCCSNDCGRVCVIPDTSGPTRCGCSVTFFTDLNEYYSSPSDIAKVSHFVWNVLQGSLSPALEPHLFFGSLENRDWLGADVQDDCLLELKIQNIQFNYPSYDPFSMDKKILLAIITDANSTFMQSYVDYFPEIFDHFIAINIGDVDQAGKLAAAANHLIEVISLDDLTRIVQEARYDIGELCTCDGLTDTSCLEAGDSCEGDCDRFAFICDEGVCQRLEPDPVPTTYKSYFGDNYDDDYYYYEYYEYYDDDYYYDYVRAGQPGGKPGPGAKPARHRNGSLAQEGDRIFPVIIEKNSTQKGQPDESSNKKTVVTSTPCTKRPYPECDGYLSLKDKEDCEKHKAKKNCPEPEAGKTNKKLAVLDEGPKRYLYRTLDYTGHCKAGLFRCSGIPNICLYGELLCNGESNCIFGEDEDEDFCSKRECLVTEFRCDSGQCINKHQECDGKTDCWDGTDEHCASDSDCSTPRTHYCGGACINPLFMCDNILDCPNGEDERDCNCTGFKCNSGECIGEYQLCNGKGDCNDQSDESSETCSGFVCQEGHSKCDSGACIPDYQVCDCNRDCTDGSDERNCLTTPVSYKWRCQSGQCIYRSFVCDGDNDCDDMSDERNCTENAYCSGFPCDSGHCVSSYDSCDMRADCPDGSDEYNCANNTCPSYKFRCGTGHCIYSSDVCNGREECPDGSDEAGCDNSEDCNTYLCTTGECVSDYQLCDGTYNCQDRKDESVCKEVTCPSHRSYKCDSGECIYTSSYRNPRCDGDKDCRDGSDEMNCEDVLCPANEPFRCGSGECIYDSWVCDHYRDCMDGSDERGCDCWYNQISCDSGRCISANSQCNGIRDCLSGNDENECDNFTCPYNRPFKCGSDVCLSDSIFCNEEADCPGDVHEVCLSRECEEYEYQCASGECVSGNRCDGYIDCRDRSDEANCEDFVCPEERPFKCGSGECIQQFHICNGYPRCKDASDETFCSNETCPPERKFYCTSGECISSRDVCDRYEDCRDGSDEVAGCEIFCPDNFNICNDNKCFPPNWICDGHEDCPNGEDEKDCDNFERQCDLHQFRCTYNDMCIPSEAVCDGFYDCSDGEDEQNCITSTTVAAP